MGRRTERPAHDTRMDCLMFTITIRPNAHGSGHEIESDWTDLGSGTGSRQPAPAMAALAADLTRVIDEELNGTAHVSASEARPATRATTPNAIAAFDRAVANAKAAVLQTAIEMASTIRAAWDLAGESALDDVDPQASKATLGEDGLADYAGLLAAMLDADGTEGLEAVLAERALVTTAFTHGIRLFVTVDVFANKRDPR
jgi:hypothetical protein